MAKPKQIVFPPGFDPNRKPQFLTRKPVEFIDDNTEKARVEIYDEDWVDLDPGLKWRFTAERYPYDDYYTYYMVGYVRNREKNPNYERDLTNYEYQKVKHEEAIKFWEDWKSIWDKEQQKKAEEKEREILKQLKEKYEK
jgi:hypothetical protein